MLDRNENFLEVFNNFNEIDSYTDRNKLKQALLNILSNAAKYTHRGEIKVQVIMTSDHSVTVSVKDSGVGIPDDQLPYIFDSFRQVDNSLSRSFSGTGLGLSITKRLFELLNGNIWVESVEGIGSTFTFEIPLIYEPNPQSSLDSSPQRFKERPHFPEF
ncbi:MAG: ATP-binding protein, partial [Chloroflexota bacterium]